MKDTGIKLTEKQLTDLFQNHSKLNTSTTDVNECLSAADASSTRLNHVEDLLNDHSSAQAMKTAMRLKDWSQVMAVSIENSRQSWFSFLGMSTPLKTSAATLAFAFALVVALPEISKFTTQEQNHIPVSQNMVHDDIISSNKFDDSNDRLGHNGFDSVQDRGQKDNLFNGTFG